MMSFSGARLNVLWSNSTDIGGTGKFSATDGKFCGPGGETHCLLLTCHKLDLVLCLLHPNPSKNSLNKSDNFYTFDWDRQRSRVIYI